MMMKKVGALFLMAALSLTLVFGLAGCGEESSSGTESAKPQTKAVREALAEARRQRRAMILFSRPP